MKRRNPIKHFICQQLRWWWNNFIKPVPKALKHD